MTTWRSEVDGSNYFLKLWELANSDNSSKERAKILDYLQRAEKLKDLSISGVCKIHEVFWTEDSIVLVKEYIEGTKLSKPEKIFHEDTGKLIKALLSLSEIVGNLHEYKIGHGDLKPENIIIRNSSNPDIMELMLTDIPDFSSIRDGERQNSKYSPDSGGTFERDRYAVTQIGRELISQFQPLKDDRLDPILEAINKCQVSEPKNRTLRPFIDALQLYLSPKILEEQRVITIKNRFINKEAFVSDYGNYHFRLDRKRKDIFYIRGLCEELKFFFNGTGKIEKVYRHKVSDVSAYETDLSLG